MTTKVDIELPDPNHKRVRVTHENLTSEGWVKNHSEDLNHGDKTDHAVVYGGRRIVIEEID